MLTKRLQLLGFAHGPRCGTQTPCYAPSISKNQNISGNDFKDFASFNSCFYHLYIALVK